MYIEVKGTITLCGSVRFMPDFIREEERLTKDGYVVLKPGTWIHIGDEDLSGEDYHLKSLLARIHIKKIDLSNRVHVINRGGYIGKSTAAEILHASRGGKEVTFMEEGSWTDGTSTTGGSAKQ